MSEGHTITRRRPTYAKIPRDLLRDPNLSNGAKIVYALLDDYANPDGPMPFPSQKTLAGFLGGVTERCVRNWLTELREAGWITVQKRPGSNGNEYDLEDRARRAPEQEFRKHRNESSGSTGTRVPPKKNQEEEPGKEFPPSPLAGGEVEPELSAPEQPGLFGPGAGGAVTVAERKARAGGALDDRIRGVYASWAEIRYPKGDRGNRVKGERALAKALRAGASMAEIDGQTANYAAARVAYHEAWAHVGNYWPSLMNASTFLNGKRELFDREWTRDDLRYWPAPAGWSWDDLAVMSHDAAVDDVPADVRAEGGLAVAMWRAKNRDAGAVAGG